MNFPAGSESYLNTRACGKTALQPHFTRVFSEWNHKRSQKSHMEAVGASKNAHFAV